MTQALTTNQPRTEPMNSATKKLLSDIIKADADATENEDYLNAFDLSSTLHRIANQAREILSKQNKGGPQ